MSSPHTYGSDLELQSQLTSSSSSPSPVRRTHSRSSSIRSPPTGGQELDLGEEPEADVVFRCLDSLEEFSDDDGSDFEDTLKKTNSKRPSRAFSKMVQAHKRIRNDESSPKDLFEAIKMGKSAIQVLVDDWLDSYKKEQALALLELVNFLIQACGCKGVVTQEMMSNMEHADIIRKMTEDFGEDSADYPLSLSTQPWKKFCLNFGEFLDKLVISCQYNIMYDDVLMDTLICLLTGLSDSQVRAFRHTSTFAAMKIMTGLVKVAKQLTHHIDTSKRQLDVERAKSPEKRAPERLENLHEKMKELSSYLEEVGNMMNSLFKGVFVHRYRDVHADVRALCMKELGIWIKIYPHSFLNDSYLKYLGWNLHDKQGHVRLQCIRSLQQLYTVPGHGGKVELFTNRFKDRILSMVQDKEPQVAAESIKLIGLISKNLENVFSAEDCASVDHLVYTTNRFVATAAGDFLYQRLLTVDLEELSPQRRNRHDADVIFFQRLMSFFNHSKLNEHAAYLVDSLWDSAGVRLKNWESQIDLLLTEAGLNDQEESLLIEILVSSLRQAAEGTSPIGRVPAKKVQSMKDKKANREDKLKLSRHMIVALPHLLAKFSADEDKMEAFLKVVGYLELEMYCTDRLEKYFDLLLTQIREILEKHTDPRVLESCSRALYILSDRKQTLHKKTDLTVSQLVDGLGDHFLKLLPDIMQVSDLDEDDVYNAAVTMKRLSALYSAYNLTKWELFDPCCQILQKAVDTGEVPEQVVLPALVCCHFSLLWTLSHLNNSQPSEEEVAALSKKQHTFIDLCQSFLSDLNRKVREQAFKLLSDLLVVFNDHLSHDDHSYLLQPLVYTPDPSLQAELAGFLVDHVFTNAMDLEGDENEQIAELHNRRILLAAYCKLILYNTLELHFASEVLKYYVKYYVHYGDIIKETLHRSRLVSKEESTRTILLSLTQSYLGFCLEDDSPDKRCAGPFLEIRELARRFALLLGPDQLRNRQDIILLHKEGIKFSLQAFTDASWSSQNLLFLDVLSEFSPKLLKQDKRALLQYFDEICKQCIPSDKEYSDEYSEIWAPLQAYKKSLSTDNEPGTTTPSRAGSHRGKDRRSARMPRTSPQRKKRRTTRDYLQDSSSVVGEARKGGPILTSTMLQERSEVSSPIRGKENEESDSDFDMRSAKQLNSLYLFCLYFVCIPWGLYYGTLPGYNSIIHAQCSPCQGLLSLMEEEEEMVIEDIQSSAGSTAGEELFPDLLDSDLLENEE
ncbi:cohesin subunit SA-3 [Pyxicephalus adspersus]|uniref:cohesin subunit SA-3 n=1 Tax=Pyxicephalus adspersus TaxID=30357 RepID=UPI003B5CAC80